jgi:hypothetical protein
MDAFTDRLSQRARDTSRPALAHQSRGRDLSTAETALAAALMEVMGHGRAQFRPHRRTSWPRAPFPPPFQGAPIGTARCWRRS